MGRTDFILMICWDIVEWKIVNLVSKQGQMLLEITKCHKLKIDKTIN